MPFICSTFAQSSKSEKKRGRFYNPNNDFHFAADRNFQIKLYKQQMSSFSVELISFGLIGHFAHGDDGDQTHIAIQGNLLQAECCLIQTDISQKSFCSQRLQRVLVALCHF